ncbi:tobH protein [Rhodococcus sp. Eu-32]|uniref:tobH protein n=1 Tax=Rhodococcus sp. Eu-32 TaxID=1017319 RepID=UPI000DF1E719|nr:tobH protein [Rhodococcus sp. Eu-32]RRQ26473.1 tobH protein [Rhodococcus sp. Eu-32]
MTAASPLFDLDDSDALVAADVDGVLRSAALAGAQARATSTAVVESVSDRLRDLRPRSVVFVCGDGRAGRAASVLVAALGSRIGVPLVHAPGTPPWVGPLDVVLVSGDDAGDPRLAESTAAAVRRGAETVLVTPDEGPLRSAAAGRAVFVPPKIAVREHNAIMRYLAAGIAVLGTLSDGAYRQLLPDLDVVADLLDAEAARNHPTHEVFHNPAKSLAARISGARVVLTGSSPVSVEIARHAGEVLFRAAGVVSATGELGDVVFAAVAAGRSAATDSGASYDPLFHDEQLDGPRPQPPVRVVVCSPPDAVALTERRTAAVPDALVLSADTTMFDPRTSGYTEAGRRVPEDRTPDIEAVNLGELGAMTLLATRLEMAAAYLHVMGGR